MTAEELRERFDRGFADAPAGERAVGHEMLRIELAGDPYAIALAELTSMHVDAKIVTVPATSPTLLGILAVRSALVPVYDLRALLGLATAVRPRWVAIAHGSGFAFDGFIGHSHVVDLGVRGVIEHDGRMHPIVDLKGVLHG